MTHSDHESSDDVVVGVRGVSLSVFRSITHEVMQQFHLHFTVGSRSKRGVIGKILTFYYQEKKRRLCSAKIFILKLADQDLLLFPKSKDFNIVVINFQPSLLEEEIYNHNR